MNGEDQVKQRINQWLWFDVNNCPHIDLSAALKEYDIEDTPENRAMVTKMASEICEAFGMTTVKRP